MRSVATKTKQRGIQEKQDYHGGAALIILKQASLNKGEEMGRIAYRMRYHHF
jgi:hypothetical protein